MDYKKIMEKAKEEKLDFLGENFNEIYEAIIDTALEYLGAKNLIPTLKAKRKFGIEKYGEHSFQASLSNALTSPTLEHALEELEDCMNYLVHEHFKASLTNPREMNKIKRAFTSALDLYWEIYELNKV